MRLQKAPEKRCVAFVLFDFLGPFWVRQVQVLLVWCMDLGWNMMGQLVNRFWCLSLFNVSFFFCLVPGSSFSRVQNTKDDAKHLGPQSDRLQVLELFHAKYPDQPVDLEVWSRLVLFYCLLYFCYIMSLYLGWQMMCLCVWVCCFREDLWCFTGVLLLLQIMCFIFGLRLHCKNSWRIEFPKDLRRLLSHAVEQKYFLSFVVWCCNVFGGFWVEHFSFMTAF